MLYQVQTKPEGRRQPWRDAEVFEGTEAQAIALIGARSAEDGRPWRIQTTSDEPVSKVSSSPDP